MLFLGVPYSVHVTTGDVRNASTSANVFVVLYGGEDGQKNSGKLVLRNENNDNFERGRTDIFHVETVDCLTPCIILPLVMIILDWELDGFVRR